MFSVYNSCTDYTLCGRVLFSPFIYSCIDYNLFEFTNYDWFKFQITDND